MTHSAALHSFQALLSLSKNINHLKTMPSWSLTVFTRFSSFKRAASPVTAAASRCRKTIIILINDEFFSFFCVLRWLGAISRNNINAHNAVWRGLGRQRHDVLMVVFFQEFTFDGTRTFGLELRNHAFHQILHTASRRNICHGKTPQKSGASGMLVWRKKEAGQGVQPFLED